MNVINRQYCSLKGKWISSEKPTIKVKDLVQYLSTLDQEWEVGCFSEYYGNMPMDLKDDIEIIASQKLILF